MPIVQAPDYSFIGRAGSIMGSAIQNLPATKEAADRRKRLNEELERIKIDELDAEAIRQERIIEMSKEYKDRIGREPTEREWTKIEATFMPPLSAQERKDPKGAMMSRSDLDDRFYKWLDREAMKAYREKTKPTQESYELTQRTRPEGSVAIEDSGQQRTTAWPQTKEEMVANAREESMNAPQTFSSVTNEPSSAQLRAAASRYRVSQAPEVKEGISYKEGMETGEAYSPAGTRAEYLAGEYAAGRGGEASQKIASAVPTEKDIMTNKRLEETARQREKYQTERLRIDAWRAAISQNKLTSDERLKIMNAKANNETDRLGLEIKIKKLENDLKSKANKTDPVTFQPMMTPEQVDASIEEIKQLRTNLAILEDFRGEYDGLIKEKGGIRPVTPAQPTSSTGIPKFNSPSDPGFQKLPSGSTFIDSNGVTRVKK